MTKRRIMIAAICVVAVALAYLGLRPRSVAVEVYDASRQTVREYISEDATTRLSDEYILDMPISGTVDRLRLKEGDPVQEGECVVTIDAFNMQQQVASAEALIAQARAQISGVDVQKPKPEDLAAADVSVKQARDTEAMAARERAAVSANFDAAKKNFDRQKELLAQGAISQSLFDEAERQFQSLAANLDAARLAQDAAAKAREVAELNAASLRASVDDNEYMRDVYRNEMESRQAQLDMMKKDLEKTEIKSPITGVVLEVYVEDERALVAGTPLLKVGSPSDIEIECDVLSEEVGRVAIGDKVIVSGKALQGQTANGSVKRIYPTGFKKISALGIEQQRVRTLIEFDNATLKLLPGTSVDVQIVVEESENAVTVPERATFRYEDAWAVFVVDGGWARLTPVEVGLKNDEWAEIKSGISEGQRVVAEPKNELEDGTRVSAL